MNIRTILTLAAATALTACGTKSQKPDTLDVVTESVTATAGATGRTYVGEVEAQTSTPVSFTGMGTVTAVLVEEGQTVAKGQRLATMDATQARNTLATMEAQLYQARDAYARMKTLHEAAALSDKDWVDIESKVRQAEASVAIAKKAIDDCTLTAPVSGVIGHGTMKTGQTALPSQPVCTILDISRVKVRAAIPEREIALVAPSTPATVTVNALGGRTFQGTHIEKGVEADAVTRTYDIRVLLPNTGRQLLPGMVAEVALASLSGQGGRAITVPVRSVQQDEQGRHFVWTVRSGKAHRTIVTTGPAQGDRITIASGLTEGDRVITAGYQKVSEGSAVRPSAE